MLQTTKCRPMPSLYYDEQLNQSSSAIAKSSVKMHSLLLTETHLVDEPPVFHPQSPMLIMRPSAFLNPPLHDLHGIDCFFGDEGMASVSPMQVRHTNRPLTRKKPPLPSTSSTKATKRLKKYMKPAQKLNRLSGFLLHSITPHETQSLASCYAIDGHSSASASTFIEYNIVIENFRSGMIWQVGRRYSAFARLRQELLYAFQCPHCHYCSGIYQQLRALDTQFPGKRLWGSKTPAVVNMRAQLFMQYLHGLLAIASNTFVLNCRLVAGSLSNRVRSFLMNDSIRYKGIPGALTIGYEIPCILRELCMARHPNEQVTLATIAECASTYSQYDQDDGMDEAHPEDDDDEKQDGSPRAVDQC